MIPEYKLYHGAVLADLVHGLTQPVSIDELAEEGRLSSYVIDGSIGLHIKHSSHRLHPWSFTFTKQNLSELLTLRAKYAAVYLVFVCHTDGMVCLKVDDAIHLLDPGASEQAWLRIDRRKRKWYDVSGSGGELGKKQPGGLEALIRAIEVSRQSAMLVAEPAAPPRPQTSKQFPFAFSWLGSRR